MVGLARVERALETYKAPVLTVELQPQNESR
jgi:hypothetical protein